MTTADIDHHMAFSQETRNDQRFDGQFFSAVLTTGIFCRPGCPGRPRSENVRFFTTAAAAAEAGFRPCLRCHPESAPDAPEWQGTSPVVSRALRLIGEGALDQGNVSDLAANLRVSPRQLQRLFVDELGAPPVAVAQTRRLLFAKKLIDETDLPMTEIAFSAGYSSVRRFNEALKQTFARTPSELRRTRRRARTDPSGATIELKLFYREPYNWAAMLGFLALHGTPLVERVDRNVYQRTIRVDGASGVISVRPLNGQRAALLRVPAILTRYLLPISERVKQIFDLKADPTAVEHALSTDEELAPIVTAHPGVRLPGCWDGFEVAVRAVLESSASGCSRELMAKVVDAFGDTIPDASDPALAHLFPTAEHLSAAPLEDAGLSVSQACTIRSLATAIYRDDLMLSSADSVECLSGRLRAIPGIDCDVAAYVALRLTGDPNLDLGRNRILWGQSANANNLAPADAYPSPWQSYAAMYRWTACRTRNNAAG